MQRNFFTNIDGGLIGGAALQVDSFVEIVKRQKMIDGNNDSSCHRVFVSDRCSAFTVW